MTTKSVFYLMLIVIGVIASTGILSWFAGKRHGMQERQETAKEVTKTGGIKSVFETGQ